MPQIVWGNSKQKLEKTVKAKTFTFLEKLQQDDTVLGLHIEPMNNAADPRARTGRVDQGLRAVLYRIEVAFGGPIYVYTGTYEHDEAIEIARTQILRVNPINGVAELINAGIPDVAFAHSEPVIPAPAHDESFLGAAGYTDEDVVTGLGFDSVTGKRLFECVDEGELLDLGASLTNQWQQTAVLGLAMRESVNVIKASLGLNSGVVPDLNETAVEQPVSAIIESADIPPSVSDDALVASLRQPASLMQFTFIEDNDELRRIIDGGDFGAWRVFLHPEQRAYASRSYKGPFRLTGGAGTGKTVVLLHRARYLALLDPGSRIVLATFTRALAEMLNRDVERLDPDLPRAKSLGDPGVLTSGIDQLATSVRDAADKSGWADASAAVLGLAVEGGAELVGNDRGWQDAIDDAAVELPETILTPSFFENEYLQVVLPHRVTSATTYATVRRSGRGVALDRAKRLRVWSVIDRYRTNARSRGQLSWAELSSIAAAYLDTHPDSRPADSVLIDEGQDLTASHWRLVRALVGEHANDLFIAEDTHQRIYGQQVVLSRYGIKIVGRSRRLTLNYRTTQQNLSFAMNVLEGGHFINAEGDAETGVGYRSARRGPVPSLLPSATATEQVAAVSEQVDEWIQSGVPPETIAILVRTKKAASQVVQQLGAKGVHVSEDTKSSRYPVVMTMHSAKGMEFSRVVLYDLSSETVPNKWLLNGATEEEREDVLLRERSLVYVAASRARDELVISWRGEPSALLGLPG